MGLDLDLVTKPVPPQLIFALVGWVEVPLLYRGTELVGRMGRLELEKVEPACSVAEGEPEPEPEPASSVVEGALEASAVWHRCEQDK